MDSITSITIPDTITSIGRAAFANCTGLTEVTLPSTLDYIDERLFENSSSLTSIDIPSSVTEIDDSAFNGSGLTQIIIPNGVTRIGSSTFNKCINLTSISIPNSVTTIDSYAFGNNPKLKSIYIPSGVTSLSYSAFRNDIGLESIVIDPNNTYYDSRDNSNAIINSNYNDLIQGCMNTVIPNTVVKIDTYSFYSNPYLTEIYIPASVKQIEPYAFRDCSNLQKATFENTENWVRANSPSATSVSQLTLTNLQLNAALLTGGTSSTQYWIDKSE